MVLEYMHYKNLFKYLRYLYFAVFNIFGMNKVIFNLKIKKAGMWMYALLYIGLL